MKWIIIYLVLTLVGPLWILTSGQVDFHAHYQTANRSSAHLAPDPKTTSEAVIQVYSAKAFNWRGLFSVHTWFAVKPKNADKYIVYQVVGWRIYHGLPPLMAESDVPDRYWFNQRPKIIFDLRGDPAERLISKIADAVKSYPYPQYELWPGPNSNTLPAYIARSVPELGLIMPANAVGKDFLPLFTFIARAPSNTGYQVSFFNLFGIMLARKEGLEINILGLIYGVSPYQHALKLPGIGEIYWK